MAEIENLTVKIDYDMQEVKDALRTERTWYLDAFRQIEQAFETGDRGLKVIAMVMCRSRIRKLTEELGE